jgi:DNA helicase-2/ATP-dependent DNA helicase PcrA
MKESHDLLADLNPRQKEAVTYPGGPLLILAGAGSGKTRVLTHRIAYLIGEKGVRPENVLAVTFTNKAAQEMNERVEKLLGGRAGALWLGTFHSACVKILRIDGERVGYSRDFSIYDEADSESLLKEIMKELDFSEKEYNPRAVRSKISGAKNALVGPEEYPCPDHYTTCVVRLYAAYNARLKGCNALDFDDLLLKVVELLSQNESVKEKYRDRFQHILVDEYQDTNRAQYLIVQLLSSKHRNIFAVGDDDQSIYGFRGADIRNILDFESDFPDVKIIRLEQNYRSTKLILKAASSVVRNNVGRMGKELWTENGEGEHMVLLQAADEEDEARLIYETLYNSGRNLRDFVILYRTNAQSRPIEETLRRAGIPYVIVGSVKFYERKEVKDVLAYMRVIVNPRDSVSLKRILNVPRRGIGPAVVRKLEEFATRNGIPLYEAILRLEEIEDIERYVNALKGFRKIIEKARGSIDEMEAAMVMSQVIDESGYIDELKQEPTREAESRIENVRELVSSAMAYQERSSETGLRGFLSEVSLYSDIDGWDERQEAVTLMTSHNAKGLEFPVVFITGLEDGLFPHSSSLGTPSEIEEERRLFYVSLTRAKEKVYLSFAGERTRWQDTVQSFPSRFIGEIPAGLIRVETSRYAGVNIGDIVRHPDWGIAKVLRVEGDGEDARAVLKFEAGFEKVVMLRYAGLTRVSKEDLWE